ncbi:MAG TPA: S41 family peptidase [Tepidisphaeraceae bacterium]|jgi:tricorn protease
MSRIALLIGLVISLPALAHADTQLLRHPTIANGKVAFSYLGSIWIADEDGSNVRRLTVNQARDVFPRFSPDGSQIAFSSNRAGNYDVYVIPAAGGRPRQLTFHSADDMAVGWTPDGKRIVFTSSRDAGVFPGVTTLFEVPVDGGMPQAIPTDWGSWASYAPDMSRLAFTRHPGVWSRQHYRGSYAVDLWVMDMADNTFTRLGDDEYKGDYYWPMYGRDGQIYFVADRLPDEKNVKFGGPQVMKSANNIWRIPEHGGTMVQVTHHTDGKLFFPSMSPDGKTIVYEENFGLWKLDVESGQSKQIPVDIRSDLKANDIELRTIQGEAESFNLSPSSKRAVIATHGELFTIATDRGEEQRVTDTPWREEDPRWSPDGKWIAFLSDRTGREEVFLSDELGHKVKQVSDADCDKGSITWAPDSKSLLWAGSDHKLRRVTIESGRTDDLVSSDVGPIGTPQFSPDGKWISYSKDDTNLRSRVYVMNLESGDEHVIGSEQFLVSSGAKWSPDGKKLLLLGGTGAAAMSSLNRTTMQLYSVPLTHVVKDPEDRDVNTEAQAQADERSGRTGRPGRGGPGGAGGPETAPSKPEVKIEFDGLDRRIKQLTRLPAGSVYAIAPSPDGRTYAFVAFGGGGDDESGAGGGPVLYTINEDGTRLTQVTQGSSAAASGAPRGRGFRGGGGGFGDPQWSKDGRQIYYMQGGAIYAVAAPAAPAGESSPSASSDSSSGRRGRGFRGIGAAPEASSGPAPSATPRRIDFTVRMLIDHAAERKQVFVEAWRVMRNRFYDRPMHGVDWDAARATYEPLLDDVADSDELHNVIMQMIGELNASHTGITGGYNPVADASAERLQTLNPGFGLAPDAESGRYKVSSILRKGPADHEWVKIHPGDFILAVNGMDLKTPDNYWKLFNLVPGRKFEFTVNSKPETEGAWTVLLDPLGGAALADLQYEQWVDARKEMVKELSHGRIGYLHIRAMDARSLDKFQRDLLDNLDKKALVIDERFNGGGGIDQELLEILSQHRKYESWRGRDSVEMPRPVEGFFGPMAVLQNERSASNAEMFPEGFRTLGLGKVIGTPTYGAVIGTGAYRLLDGSSIRTPSFGVYTAQGTSFENYGVQPDVLVDNTPSDFLAGHDRQIEKAVEVLSGEVQQANAK